MNEKNMVYRFISIAVVILILIGMIEGSCVSSYAASKKPAKVKISSLKASGLKMTLKWKKAKNAKKYQVYVKMGAAKWALKKTLKKTAFSMSGAEGTEYCFKVRGVNGKKKGSFSTIKKISIPKEEKPEEDIDGEITILEQPEMQVAKDGDKVTFSVRAEGKNLKYQWYISGSDSNTGGKRIAGADGPEYTLTASPENKGTFYYCVISNSSMSVKTKAVELDVLLENHVYITEQPEGQTVTEGQNAVFSVTTQGTGDLNYQWYRSDTDDGASGTKLEGENKEKLVINARLNIDDTYYYCIVRDDISMMTTDVVKLDVTVSPLRSKMVSDVEAFIEENGVLSEKTVNIDDTEFYVLAKEGEKALLYAKETWEYYPQGDNVYHFYTESGAWNYASQSPYNIRNAVNGEYINSRPTIDLTVLETTLTTPNNKVNKGYYETKEKAFILTEADITGYYSEEGTDPRDFSFDQTEGHIGRALPKAIIKGAEGNADHWLRSPWESADPKYPTPEYIRVDEEGNYEIRQRNYHEFITIGARPAMWVDLSIK